MNTHDADLLHAAQLLRLHATDDTPVSSTLLVICYVAPSLSKSRPDNFDPILCLISHPNLFLT